MYHARVITGSSYLIRAEKKFTTVLDLFTEKPVGLQHYELLAGLFSPRKA
jgi:hypothetical protein